MPIGKIEIDSILGLTTSRNETSGINSPAWSSMSSWAVENSSSGATTPNSLYDCSNIVISRNKQAAARPAFAEIWDFTSTYGSDPTFFTKGLYAIPNSTINSLIFVWVNSTTANIANFSDASDVQMTSAVNIIGGTQSTSFTSLGNLLCDFSWAILFFPIKSFNIARFNTSYTNIYIFSSNGVYRTTSQYIQNVGGGNFNNFKRVTLPLVLSVAGQITASPADANRWFPSGFLVNIKILVTDQLSGTQVYQGKPSRTLILQNTGTLSSVQVTFVIDNTNISTLAGGIEIYRTISYSPTDLAPPTDYYKCYEASFSTGTIGGGGNAYKTTFTNVELTLNDTSIATFQQLYTSLNVESSTLQSAESAAPPTARDVINYNNFTVYGNVMCPPFATLTMINLPNTDGLDILKVGATTANVTYVPNSTTPPANTGVINSTTGTYKGVSSLPNGGKGYNLVIRPQDPTITTASAVPASYSYPWYALAQKLVLTTGTGATQDIQITPLANALFDITQFPATGIVAVIQTTTTGNVVAMFSYQSFTQTTASGYYTFNNCLAYGVPFTDLTWTDSTGNGLPTAGQYVLYALPGTTVTALSVYAIGSNATGYSSQLGFSLLATYELFPNRKFNQIPVGYTSSLTQITASTAMVPWQPVVASINFFGIFAQNAGQLLNQCVQTLCDTYNISKLSEDPYAVFVDSTTAPVGQIRFESIYSGYNRLSPYANNSSYTNGHGYYDAILAQVYRASGTPVVKFAEPIPYNTNSSSNSVNIMQQPVQTVAGLTASKYNKPEEIPIGQNLTPLIVGDPLKPIIKLVNQYNQMLVFKQNEGTYKTSYQQAGGVGVLPGVEFLTLLDNTAWLLLPESVQVFEGSVVYFSNKAFVTISHDGQVSQISPTIETELLNDYTTILSNGDVDNVRSWVITQQRLYCCYFPHVNFDNTSTIYVFSFNTGQWTKWSGEINDAAVSAPGVLSLIENIFQLSSQVLNYEQLQLASINTSSKYWSVIRQSNFQNPSNTQIEDIMPFSAFTVTQITGLSDVEIQISNFNASSVYGNLYNILMLFKNRTFWYQSATQGFFSATLIETQSSPTFIKLRLVDNIYTQNPILPDGFVATVNDSIVTTVNTAIYFNKFFIANPRGSTMSHYNEVQLYTQQGQQYSNVAVGFNSIEGTSQYIYTSSNPNPQTSPLTPPNTIITTTNGTFITLTSITYDLYAPYYVLASNQYSFRVLVPRDSARGRFIQLAILHDTPNEVFLLNSIVYIYRDLNSTKIKFNNG